MNKRRTIKATAQQERNLSIQAELSVEAEGVIPSFRLEPAYSGGKMNLPDWDYPVVAVCSGVETQQSIPLLKKHFQFPLGNTSEVKIDNEISAHGLFSMKDTNWETRKAIDEIIKASKQGYSWQASIGTDPIDDDDIDFVPKGKSLTVNGQKLKGPFYVVRSCVLREISIVVLGADPNTKVTIEASKDETGDDEDMKRRINADAQAQANNQTDSAAATQVTDQPAPASNNATQTQPAAATVQAESGNAPTVNTPTASTPPAQTVQAESGQQVHYHFHGSDWTPENVAERIQGRRGVTAGGERRDDGVNMVSRTEDNRTFRSNEGPSSGDIIEAALLMNAGIQANRCEALGVSQNAIHEAVSGEYRSFSLRNLFIAAMRQFDSGFSGRNYGDISANEFQSFLRHVNAQAIELNGNLRRNSIQASSSFSTLSLPGILSNIAHKTLLNAFTGVESVLEKIASQTTTKDFKTYHLYRLTLDGDFAEIGDGGELEDVTLKETERTNKTRLHGAAITWTYQMFVNDDLNALSQIGKQLGRRARQNQNKMAFKLLNSMIVDPKYFSEALGNKMTYKLSVEGVSSAFSKFAELKDDAGELIELTPKYILTAPALKAYASMIQKSTEVQIASKRMASKVNPVAGMFEGVSTPYFGTAGGGVSDAHWLTLADPNDCPVMDAAFLNGQREPQIETFDTDPRTLGVIMRAVFSFGIAAADTRGAIYSDGTTNPPEMVVV